MASEPALLKLSDLVELGPKRHLPKGTVSPGIDMAALAVGSRDIERSGIEVKQFSGSGTKFQDGDVLFARITPCLENGKTAQVRGLGPDVIAHGSTEFIVMVAKRPEDVQFSYYLARDPSFREYAIQHMEGTSGRQRVTAGALADYEFLCVAPAEREAVGALLGALDDRIENLRATNEALEAIVQTLFKSWFVDFDPVRAKLVGEAPAGMDAETAALFPGELVGMSKASIPVGWGLSTVGTVFSVTMGQSPPGSTYNQERIGIPFFQGSTDFGAVFPQNRVFCTAPTRRAKQTDTLVSVRAPVGTVNVALDDCAIGRGVAAVRHDSCPAFAFAAMKTLKHYFATFEADGTVFGSINKLQFLGLPMVNPPAPVLKAFQEVAGPLLDLLREGELESRQLSRVRDELLPKLISGELRLPGFGAAAL